MSGPLADLERNLGALFTERDSVSIPDSFGDPLTECREIVEGAGALDFSWYATMRVQGRDRISWLHKLTTANVEALGEGRGTHALLLNATGHVVADFVLLVLRDELILYSSRAAVARLQASFRRAIFREKVVVDNGGEEKVILSLQGSRVRDILAPVLEFDVPLERFSFISTSDLILVNNPRAGGQGYDILAPSDKVVEAWNRLVAAGARPVGLQALYTARLEAGIPWYGDDFDESVLAPEARLDSLIAENKGCYTGQEVIARIRNRGHVNRLLTQIRTLGDTLPSRSDPIVIQGLQVGWITSSAWSFRGNAPLSLGYMRREHAEPGTRLGILHGSAELEAVVAGIASPHL